jgi:hypothetical protein
MTWLVNLAFFAAWLILAFFALRLAGGRFFHEPGRASVAALAVVAAFAAGTTIWPYSSRIGGVPSDFVPSTATPSPPPPMRIVSDACTSKAVLEKGGPGNLDGVLNAAGVNIGDDAVILRNDAITVVGWGADASGKRPAVAVCLVVDGQLVSGVKSRYGGSRPDVAASLHQPALLSSQFDITLPPALLTTGAHRLRVAVKSADASFRIINGAKTVTVVAH